jgi:hypothetical protein
LTFPSLSTVLTSAIGLGATDVNKNPCVSWRVRFLVSKDWKGIIIIHDCKFTGFD